MTWQTERSIDYHKNLIQEFTWALGNMQTRLAFAIECSPQDVAWYRDQVATYQHRIKVCQRRIEELSN